MSEITKLYENAGVAKIGIRKCTTCEYLDCQNYCFISESNKCDKFSYHQNGASGDNFEESLAGLINSLWQDLTEEERKQIKEILE